MEMKRKNSEDMKNFHMRLKNKGFLLIATTTIIAAILASFLISYKLSINRGKKVAAFLKRNKKINSLESMKIFTYDELYRIDCAINRGEYRNATEFITKCEGKKIWLSNDKKKVTDNGYSISKFHCFNKEGVPVCFYPNENYSGSSDSSFKELIERELNVSRKRAKTIQVELTKEFFIEGTNKKIITKALIHLYYEIGNTNANNPQKEILKEFETSLEDI